MPQGIPLSLSLSSSSSLSLLLSLSLFLCLSKMYWCNGMYSHIFRVRLCGWEAFARLREASPKFLIIPHATTMLRLSGVTRSNCESLQICTRLSAVMPLTLDKHFMAIEVKCQSVTMRKLSRPNLHPYTSISDTHIMRLSKTSSVWNLQSGVCIYHVKWELTHQTSLISTSGNNAFLLLDSG